MNRHVVWLFRRIYRSYKNNGLGHVLRMLVAYPAREASRRLSRRRMHKAASAPQLPDFDRQHGVDTGSGWGGALALADISSPNWIHGYHYQSLGEELMRVMMDHLPIRHEDFVFVDLGSGKGKILLMAAEYPFRRITGVEYSLSLHEAARRNIETYRNPQQKCMDVESVCLDATQFVIPPRPCVFFLYNPFDQTILAPVVQRMVESLQRVPRPMYVVYCNAVHADVFLSHGFREDFTFDSLGESNILFAAPEFPGRHTIGPTSP